MNEKKFINKTTIGYYYNAKIIKKYNFNLYLEDCLFHDKSVIGRMDVPINKINNISIQCIDSNKAYKILNCGISHNGYEFYGEDAKTGKISVPINFGVNINKASQKFKLYIDDHLNIIIPEIKTIIINNYSSFPLYALYAIYNEHLDVYENCIYNKHNKKDKDDFNVINDTIKEFTNYLISDDQRNKFNDGNMFNKLLDFIYYENISIDIKKYLNFMASINISSNDKKDIVYSNDNAVDIHKKDISINELTQKNISYEKIIQALEIDNKQYRSDISEYKLLTDKYSGEIYKLNASIIEYTEDIQKMRLEKLQQSRQLIELDIIKQNMTDMKAQITTLNETISQYQSKEQKHSIEKQTLISKLSLQFEEIDKIKKELTEFRKLEKQLNNTIDAIKKENIIYTSQIEEKDTLIQSLKDKITELLKPVESINTNSSYDSVLFQQIKDLQSDIEKYKKQIEDNKKENELISKKYNDMQTKMKSLLGVI
jgi:hypothetical protein